MAEVIRNAIVKHLEDIERLDTEELLAERQRRIGAFGVFKEA